MTSRYLIVEQHEHTATPRCDLPGSPFPSKRAALKAAKRLAVPTFIKSVKRTVL